MADKTRRYSAPGREAQARRTRTTILTVAHDLFVREGFAVTVREVAQRAEVSAATVELLFGTKARLLRAVVDVALAGDDDPVPILERAWVRGLNDLPVEALLVRVGTEFALGAVRVSPVLRAVDEGSTRDAALTEFAAEMLRRRTVMAHWVVDQVIARDALAADLNVDTATATVMVLLDPLVHRRLLVDQRWSADQLGGWLGRALQRLLLRSAAP